MNKKQFITYTFLAFCFILVHYLVFLNMTSHLCEFHSGEEYAADINFPESLRLSTDSFTQYFTPCHTGLQEIRIRLAYNHEDILNNYPPETCLVLKQGDSILQSQKICSTDFENWRYFSFIPDVILKKGQTYSLSLSQISGYTDPNTNEYPLSLVPFINKIDASSEWLPENIGCAYNDTPASYQWDIIYIYNFYDLKQILWVLFTDLICIAILFVFRSFILYSRKYTCYIFLLIAAPVNFVLVESITGNINTMPTAYIIINILINYLVLSLFTLFFRKIKTALFAYQIICPLAGLVEYYVYKFRGRPFMLHDLSAIQTARSVMKQYSYELNTQSAIPLLLALLFLFMILQLPDTHIGKHALFQKALSIGITCIFAIFLFNINLLNLDLWDIDSNYHTYGYFLTLISEISLLDKTAPDGYSIKAAEAIAANDCIPASNLTNDNTTPQNIILIMNESWGDFRNIASYHNDATITPYIDNLSGKNVIKGNLHVPVFGAGTANSEYEVLTGNSMQFIGISETAYQLHVSPNEYGLASTLKAQGYRTLAMHPNNAYNWNRNNVYSYMNFDEFISSEKWPEENINLVRWYISDQSCYDVLINQYEQKSEDEKLFTFLVTMQNHGGYDYPDYTSTVNLDYNTSYSFTEQYLSILKESDAAFKTLIDYFKTVNDPTIIIMFGDHLPNVDTSFYEMLFNTAWDDIPFQKRQKLYTTPFVIWSNYDLNDYSISELSANYFGSYILQLTRLEMPAYNKCLLNYMQTIPVIGTGMIMDSSGNWYDLDHVPETYQSILSDYQILQYNNVYGKHKKIDAIFSLQNNVSVP